MWIKRIIWAATLVFMMPNLAIGQPAFGLTISGAIEEGSVTLSRDDLAQIDWVEIETYTSFTYGPQVFSGPRLSNVLQAIGATGSQIKAVALNGYFVTFPVSDATDHNVLLAMDHDGRPMRIRDKGPIWVVYPLNEDMSFQKPFDNEMIWQLTSLEVLP